MVAPVMDPFGSIRWGAAAVMAPSTVSPLGRSWTSGGTACPWLPGRMQAVAAPAFGRLPVPVRLCRTSAERVEPWKALCALVVAGASVALGGVRRRTVSSRERGLPGIAATVGPIAFFSGRQLCRVQRRAFDESDGPDNFFYRNPRAPKKVVPAWNGHTSPTKVKMSEPVVFFFPTEDKQDPANNGFVNPRMYKRRTLCKRLRVRRFRDRKRAWRQLSRRLKDEWRFRRFPRDESGKVIPGVFQRRTNPAYIALKKH